MKKLTSTLLIAFLLFNFGCKKPIDSEPLQDPVTLEVSEKTQQLINNSNEFGFDVFKEVLNSSLEDQNVMYSPLSATLALAMTYNGAAGTTKTAFENTLHLTGLTPEEINQSMYDLCDALTGVDSKITLDLANSIWYRNTFSVESDFLDTNKKYYDAEVSDLDFNDPNSVNIVNNWVNDKTNGKIPTIINEINPAEVMYLINATYFKGNWRSKFDPSLTENEPFTLQNGTTIQVPTMKQETKMGALNNDLFTAVELSYGRGNFSMVLMIPQTGKTLSDLENELNQENWQNWMDQMMDSVKLVIHLPKFTFSYEKTLNQELKNLGLGIAFDALNADFSKINPNDPFWISFVKQKTYVKVDEEGTEAAAVTVVGGVTSSLPVSVFFNHPFLFAIREKSTGTILFIGRVMDPSQE